MIRLSVRLEAIASTVKPCRTLADIGTDHGFLPIELVRRGVCTRAYACDVRKGPLDRAQSHIALAGLTGSVIPLLSDGLAALERDTIDTAVMAGMGGRLISRILLESAERGDSSPLSGLSQLILQPQSELPLVRKTLCRVGFTIDDEVMVTDRGKFYWIFHTCPSASRSAGHPAVTKAGDETEEELAFGHILAQRKDPVLKEYLSKRLDVTTRLLEELSGQSAEEGSSAYVRYGQLAKEKNLIEKELEKWE